MVYKVVWKHIQEVFHQVNTFRECFIKKTHSGSVTSSKHIQGMFHQENTFRKCYINNQYWNSLLGQFHHQSVRGWNFTRACGPSLLSIEHQTSWGTWPVLLFLFHHWNQLKHQHNELLRPRIGSVLALNWLQSTMPPQPQPALGAVHTDPSLS